MVDSYSAIKNNVSYFEGTWHDADGKTLANTWKGALAGIDSVYAVGLALDYCVKYTAREAADTKKGLGKKTYVISDVT